MNNKLSSKELNAIIILSVLGFNILLLPKICGNIMSVLLAVVAGLLLMIIAIYSSIDIYSNKVWKVLYFAKNMFVIILLIRILSDAISKVMLREMNIHLIIIMITLLVIYCGFKGIEVIGRISQFLFWFILIGSLYVYFMSVQDLEIKYITLNINGVNPYAFLYGFLINTSEIVILTKDNMKESKHKLLKSAFLSSGILLLLSLIIVGKIGEIGINNVTYPSFELIYTADLPNYFIKRQEGIFLSLWIISSFITLFVYSFSVHNIVKTVTDNKVLAPLFVLIIVLIFIFFYNTPSSTIKDYCILQIFMGIFTGFIIPLCYLGRKLE